MVWMEYWNCENPDGQHVGPRTRGPLTVELTNSATNLALPFKASLWTLDLSLAAADLSAIANMPMCAQYVGVLEVKVGWMYWIYLLSPDCLAG